MNPKSPTLSEILIGLGYKIVKDSEVSKATSLILTNSELIKLEAAIEALIAREVVKGKKQTASDIFNLAHEYAQDDKTMKGSENLRNYHYYNAIAKIGEFDGR